MSFLADAASVLCIIGTERARELVEALAEDPQPQVRELVEELLAEWGEAAP